MNTERAKLIATPAVKLANVSLGENSSDHGMKALHSLSQRKRWISEGKAMQDGSFPIPNIPHLKYALEAYEFAENRRKAQRWIVRRAKALGRIDLLPEAWQRSVIVAAAGDEEVQVNPGGMIAIYPPPELAEILAGPKATDEPAEELHVTLAFLADDASVFDAAARAQIATAIAAAVLQSEPMEANVQGAGWFLGKDEGSENPVWYSVNCLGLAAFRSAIVEALTASGIEIPQDHDFVPHMTVRYGDPQVTEIPAGGEKAWPVDNVYLVLAGDRMAFPLGAPVEEEPMMEDVPEEIPPAQDEEIPAEVAPAFAVMANDDNKLKQYWLHGEGAAKWSTWTQLYNHIKKHVPPEYAKRIAAQWFHDRYGYWPGDKRND
jgi:2'-5' RNA ligase